MRNFFKIFFSLIFLIFSSQTIFAQTYQNIDIPCEVKECKTEWGPINTRWYKGDGNKKRPAIIWYGGGKGNYTSADNQPGREPPHRRASSQARETPRDA